MQFKLISILRKKIKWRPKLSYILLIVNLTVLILPIGGIYFFRFYENELVRQTESELISQASLIAALYKSQLKNILDDDIPYGIKPKITSIKNNDYYQPIPALLDLHNAEILPAETPELSTKFLADKIAITIGKNIDEIIKEAHRTTLASVRVTDYKGIVVASTRGDIGLNFINITEIKKALEGNYNSSIRWRISNEQSPPLSSISRGSNIRVFIGFPIIANDHIVGAIGMSRSPKNILKALNDRKFAVIMLAFGLLSIVTLLTIFTSYTINKPIYSLIKKAQRISKGEKVGNIEFDPHITREITILSQSLSSMAKTIENRSEYIKNFARALSHEFKTPLTSIGGTIEILQEHLENMDIAKRQRFLDNIAEDNLRLRNLVEKLLELAKADVTKPQNEVISNFSEVVTKLSSRYQDLGLNIKIDNHLNSINLQISPEIIETILTNLFDNSLNNGATKVTISYNESDNKIYIKINDNGKGISAQNQDKIFTPFFTTNRENGGTGLGLPIVKSLLNNHNGDIIVNNCSNGASFSLIFLKNI